MHSNRLLFHHAQYAVHAPPMTWESTHVRVVTRLGGRGELEREALPWINQRSRVQYFRNFGDILLVKSIGAAQPVVGGLADHVKRAWLDDQEVMLHHVGIIKYQCNTLSCPHCHQL